ncbi:hypothetical protein NLI96_g13235 [Meripilus lineatus]|uniref:Uncharacterized protein n=1 Tax=Meripilus lineatus TaxID=2056292 RepID=A0AAD5YBP0_9APHY|nr:hypothetical protein NLI96_g13235 [Physisporinus lineatus]
MISLLPISIPLSISVFIPLPVSVTITISVSIRISRPSRSLREAAAPTIDEECVVTNDGLGGKCAIAILALTNDGGGLFTGGLAGTTTGCTTVTGVGGSACEFD